MIHARHKWIFFLPLLLGIGVFAALKGNNSGAEKLPQTERATPVRTLVPPVVAVRPQVSAHGSVRPASVWSAVAEVSGEVIRVHPDLSVGKLIHAGEELFAIDPVDYELAAAQARAQVSAARTQLADLDTQQANVEALLELEQTALAIAERELKRQQGLLAKGSVSRSSYDKEQQSTLARRQSVQNQKNALANMPAQRQLKQAELARLQAALAQAERNLARTVVRAPHAGRVALAAAEHGEYIKQGATLVELDAIDRAEVSVQLPIRQMAALLQQSPSAAADGAAAPDTLIEAQVSMNLDGRELRWPARVERIADQIDPTTRTVGLIVAVDDPYENLELGRRPPLMKGLFVRVELRAKHARQLALLPRGAVDAGTVKIVDAERRLGRAAIEPVITLHDYIAFDNTLPADTAVVVSDLIPAIDKMLLTPVADDATRAALIAQASGEATP